MFSSREFIYNMQEERGLSKEKVTIKKQCKSVTFVTFVPYYAKREGNNGWEIIKSDNSKSCAKSVTFVTS